MFVQIKIPGPKMASGNGVLGSSLAAIEIHRKNIEKSVSSEPLGLEA